MRPASESAKARNRVLEGGGAEGWRDLFEVGKYNIT
jgi:hypothetical protein